MTRSWGRGSLTDSPLIDGRTDVFRAVVAVLTVKHFDVRARVSMVTALLEF